MKNQVSRLLQLYAEVLKLSACLRVRLGKTPILRISCLYAELLLRLRSFTHKIAVTQKVYSAFSLTWISLWNASTWDILLTWISGKDLD